MFIRLYSYSYSYFYSGNLLNIPKKIDLKCTKQNKSHKNKIGEIKNGLGNEK